MVIKGVNFNNKWTVFIGKLQNNSRFEAWDICNDEFGKVIKGNNAPNKYNLALHLYAFLASYGMVCRGCQLLQHNYRYLIPVVEVLIDKKYAPLYNIDIFSSSFNSSAYIALVLELKKDLTTALGFNNVTSTLISKIMLGALGCVVGYDVNVIKTLRKKCNCTARLSAKGLSDLLALAKSYKSDIINAKNSYHAYSDMRILDSVLW